MTSARGLGRLPAADEWPLRVGLSRWVRALRPGRRQFRPIGRNDQQRRGRRLLDQHAERFQCRRIGPVQVLPSQKNGNAPKFRGRFDVRTVTFDVPIRPPFAPSPEVAQSRP